MINCSNAISVIIPVYNGEQFVVEAIQCALDQTLKPLEIIVVDDASTDRTAALVLEGFAVHIASGQVRYVQNERNSERSFSRNEGCRVARGDLVFFLDYDDLWKAEYLETVAAEFSDDSVDVVYSFPRTFIDEQQRLLRCSNKSISNDVAVLVFSSQVGYPTATAMRREKFPGYAEYCILREDWEIFLRMQLSDAHIKVLDLNQVLMRAHGGRTSKSVKFWWSTLQVYKHYQNSIPPAYNGLFLYHVADICMRYGDLMQGWKLVFRAIFKGYLPDGRILHRLLTRGVRWDRYFSLASARNAYEAELKSS